jgi:protein deglycase
MKVMVILAEGFEEIEAITIIDILRRANISVISVGLTSRTITGSHSITISSDSLIDDELSKLSEYQMVVLPGGLPGSNNLRDDSRIISLLQKMNQEKKYTAAICAAPIVLAKAGLLDGKKATSYPGQLEKLSLPTTQVVKESVVVDGTVITSGGPATAIEFSLALVEILVGNQKRNDLAEKLLFR